MTPWRGQGATRPRSPGAQEPRIRDRSRRTPAPAPAPFLWASTSSSVAADQVPPEVTERGADSPGEPPLGSRPAEVLTRFGSPSCVSALPPALDRPAGEAGFLGEHGSSGGRCVGGGGQPIHSFIHSFKQFLLGKTASLSEGPKSSLVRERWPGGC